MKFGVVIFPGSNCDHDLIEVLERTSGQKVELLWHKDTDLKGVDFVFLPGGFSFGDYLRSGAIAKLSPIMQSVIEHANNGGYVMGICNGFQILCESGLLEGALLRNQNQLFICENVYLKTASTNTIITQNFDKNSIVKIPIAHAEGRFYADEKTIAELIDNDQVLFYYCDENGHVHKGTNPNGSTMSIAGITNKNRNVFGMMPHPERAADAKLFNTDGLAMFEGIMAMTNA
ncbi:MAG: phosphoribosylformylglycinamidine synthase subunit PurQ [Flavobacteriales bacterium]|nr:phosphoribosylformylglycinamidine synthase subunit PurQ [Flavobacteriales bacterium]